MIDKAKFLGMIWESYEEVAKKEKGHGKITVDIGNFECENLDTTYRRRPNKENNMYNSKT